MGPAQGVDPGVYFNYHAGDDIAAVLGATCKRNSPAWQRDETGTWVSVAANVWRDNHHPPGALYTGRQFMAEPPATNVAPYGCRFGINGTTGWTLAGGDGATLSVVDDETEIHASGLQLLAGDSACLRLDNSASSTPADACVSLGTLSRDRYSFLVNVRGGTGSIFLLQSHAFGGVPFGSFARYTAVVSRNILPAAEPGTLCIRADAGQIILFLLTQMEIGASETSPIPNETSGSVTRAVDVLSWPFPAAPGPMAIYMRRTWTPFHQFNPYLGIGSAEVSAGQFIHLGHDNGTHTRMVTDGTASVSGDTINPEIGDDCMVVGRFDSLGNGQCEQSVNGQASTFSVPAADSLGYDAKFAIPTAAIGRYTGVALPIIGSHIVFARNTALTLAELEAL